MKIDKKIFFVILFAVSGCANTVKPVNPWVGLWKISQNSFEDAQKGRVFVKLKDDGSYTTGYYKNGNFNTVIAHGKWRVKDGRFIDTKPNGVVTANVEKLEKGRVHLLTDNGEEIFLIRYR